MELKEFLERLLGHSKFTGGSGGVEFTPRKVGVGFRAVTTAGAAVTGIVKAAKKEARQRKKAEQSEAVGGGQNGQNRQNEEQSKMTYILKRRKRDP